MSLVEDSVLINITHRQVLQNKLNRLTAWEKFVTCLYLLGWSLTEIARMADLTKQAISYTFNEAKKKMGVYYDTYREMS